MHFLVSITPKIIKFPQTDDEKAKLAEEFKQAPLRLQIMYFISLQNIKEKR